MNIGNYLNDLISNMSEGSELPKPNDPNTIKVDTDYIVEEKPSVKIVREFFRANLKSIKSEEEVMFDNK